MTSYIYLLQQAITFSTSFKATSYNVIKILNPYVLNTSISSTILHTYYVFLDF